MLIDEASFSIVKSGKWKQKTRGCGLHQRAGKPSELIQDLKKPAQNAPLTRSPRGDGGDDGDGTDQSAWVENKKQDGAVSSEAAGMSISESLKTTLDPDSSHTLRWGGRLNFAR